MYPSLHVYTMKVETVCAGNFGDSAHWVGKASDCTPTVVFFCVASPWLRLQSSRFSHELNANVNDKARFDHPFALEKRLVLNLTKRGILHNHQIGALAQLLELEYSKAVVSNAGTLAKALIAKGHKLAIGELPITWCFGIFFHKSDSVLVPLLFSMCITQNLRMKGRSQCCACTLCSSTCFGRTSNRWPSYS